MITSKKFSLALLIIVGASQVQASDVVAETAAKVAKPQASKMERFKNFSKNAALTVYNKVVQHQGKIAVIGAAAVAATAIYQREALLANSIHLVNGSKKINKYFLKGVSLLSKSMAVGAVVGIAASMGFIAGKLEHQQEEVRQRVRVLEDCKNVLNELRILLINIEAQVSEQPGIEQ